MLIFGQVLSFVNYFCELDFISLHLKTTKHTESKRLKKIGFENVIGKGGHSVNPFPNKPWFLCV